MHTSPPHVGNVSAPEFGPTDQGKVFKIVRALYGLKSAGASFRAFLAEHFRDMGYRPTLADPDVWLRKAVKPNGDRYYEMILSYVDDILSISDVPEKTMTQIQQKFKLKKDEYKEPTGYLGAAISKMTTANGTSCWTQSSDEYVAASLKEIRAVLARKGRSLPTRCKTPLSSGYRPEIDVTAELQADGMKYFQELIGIGHVSWADLTFFMKSRCYHNTWQCREKDISSRHCTSSDT